MIKKKRKLLKKLSNHLQLGLGFRGSDFARMNDLSDSEYERLCRTVGSILRTYLQLTNKKNRNFFKNFLDIPSGYLRSRRIKKRKRYD